MRGDERNIWRQYDVYQRYRLLARVLEAMFPAGPVRVLDIGSGPDDLCRSFLSDRFTVTLADTEVHERPDIALLQPGAPLPFEDRSFDVVLAMDVLEHVPGEGRPPLLRELARTAATGVVLSYPNGTPGVEAAEDLIAAAYLSWFGSSSRFLAEHKALGLPAVDLARDALRAAGFAVDSVADGPLADWLPFTVLDIALLAQFGTGGAKDDFNRAVNAATDGTVAPGEHYRTLLFAMRDGTELERASARLAAEVRPRAASDNSAIAQALTKTLIALGQMPGRHEAAKLLREKDEHIMKLEGAFHEHIAQLNAALHEQGAHAGALVAAKDEHIRKLVVQALQQAEAMQAVIQAKDQHIRKLELLIRGKNPASK